MRWLWRVFFKGDTGRWENWDADGLTDEDVTHHVPGWRFEEVLPRLVVREDEHEIQVFIREDLVE